MAIVVKWVGNGSYLSGLRGGGRTVPWAYWDGRRCVAKRFDSQAHARKVLREHFGCWPVWNAECIKCIRLVPKKRHASPQP